VGEVVDVLGGAGEVDEFGDGGQFGQLIAHLLKALLDEVFHRLDVVVGGLLRGLDGLGVLQAEIGDHGIQERVRGVGEGATSGIPGSAARCWSQRTSTVTRERMSPYSLKIPRSWDTLSP